ncbi:unnamed protein product [Knipowitschia caucasica]
MRSPQLCVLLLWTSAVFAAADPLCDPETQYLLNGECCQMCKPGTRMESNGECVNPVCRDCEENEYTDKYNTEKTCQLQPYCDPNLGFLWPESRPKTERFVCLCRAGSHCSSSSCTKCLNHTQCDPGYGATTIGGQTQDTVCEECPKGTFSDEKSWNGTCKNMTKCAFGYGPQGGSSEADNVCEFNRGHIGVICAVLIPILLAVGIYLICRCKGKTGHDPLPMVTVVSKETVAVEEEKLNPLITHPTDDQAESLPSHPAQETSLQSNSLPEESDYSFPTRVLTENGHILSQDGKEHILSQTETLEISVS